MLTEETIHDLHSTAQQGKDAVEEGGIEEAYEALDSIQESLEYIMFNYKVKFIEREVGGE
jgi:HD superfamily phosphodiesterase